MPVGRRADPAAGLRGCLGDNPDETIHDVWLAERAPHAWGKKGAGTPFPHLKDARIRGLADDRCVAAGGSQDNQLCGRKPLDYRRELTYYALYSILEVIEMTDAAVLVRTARKNCGLTQGQLAVRAGVDQARISRFERARQNPRFGTVERLLAGASHRLYAAPTTRDDAATIASHIRDSLNHDDPRLALRYLIQLNDNLVSEHGIVRGVLAVAEPGATGQKVWDAAVAALVSWRLNEEKVPLPEWVSRPERKLARARVLRVDPADPVPKLGDVPDEFAEHGVLAWRDTFASV